MLFPASGRNICTGFELFKEKERKACSRELPPCGASLLEHWLGWKRHLGVLIALNDYRGLLSVQPELQDCDSCFLMEKECPSHSSRHAQHEGTGETNR